MVDNISLLIHGPFGGNALGQIFREFNKLSNEKRNQIKIVLVSYVTDYEANRKLVDEIGMIEKVNIIQVKDVFNSGFFNINRQIITVQAGLENISDDDFVIKLRNDQWVSFSKLFKILDKADWLKSKEHLLSTNCFTRKDRLYHPSDMFLCGWKKELVEYYGMQLMGETHLSLQYKMVLRCKENPDDFPIIFECPEKILFMNYLKKKKWNIKNTYDDSYEAIKRYIFLINSWDIDLRWNKKRNPLLKEGSIILPYFFTMAPFKNAPEEKARCYMRHDFFGKLNIRDIWFICEARLLYFIQYTLREFPHRCLYSLACWARGNGKVVNILQHSPFWKLLVIMSQKLHLQ